VAVRAVVFNAPGGVSRGGQRKQVEA